MARAPGDQLDHAAGEQDQRPATARRGGGGRRPRAGRPPAHGVPRGAPPARRRPATSRRARRPPATAAPAPAPAPSTHSGGCPDRNSTDRPRITIRPGTMKRPRRPARPAGRAPARRRRSPAGWTPDRAAGCRPRSRPRTPARPAIPALDAQLAQQRDVGGRAAEPDAADPAPLPQHRYQGYLRRRGSQTRRDRLRVGRRCPRAGSSQRRLGSRGGGLEQLDHVAGRVLGQDLLPAGAGDDLVAEAHALRRAAGRLPRRCRRR